MDTLTHVIIGATVARATTSDRPIAGRIPLNHRLWLAGLAAAFPDIDYLSYPIDPLSFISDWHRSITHSLLMLPIWSYAMAVIYVRISHRKNQLQEATLLCALVLLSHIMMDIITSWGTQVFAPVSSYSLSLGLAFVIDPYLSLLVLAGLILSLWRSSGKLAAVALIMLVVYISALGLLKQQANALAESSAKNHNWAAHNIYTMPQPYSPFHWKIVVVDHELYHMTHVDLIGSRKIDALKPWLGRIFKGWQHYRSSDRLVWQQYTRFGPAQQRATSLSAWQDPEFERYRKFALLPAYRRSQVKQNETCIEFMDLRYVIPGLDPSFKYALCKDTTHNRSRALQLP